MAYDLISGDNHIDLTYCPPDLWSEAAPGKWKLLAPRTEELDDGLHWFVEAQDKGMWNGVGPGFLKYQQGSFKHVDEMRAVGFEWDYRRGAKPRPELKIVETRVYRGPNYWNYDPAIKLIVDLGVLEYFPSNTIPGFVTALLEMLPAVGQHTCGTGRVAGFTDRLNEGTWLGHVAEHVALQLQREAGTEVGRGKTRSTGEPGRYHVVYSYAEESVGVAAGKLAVRLVNHLVQAEDGFDFGARV